MRYLLVLTLLLTACGGDSTGPSPQTGTLNFTLDPVTCAGQSGTIELFVDSQSQGSFSFSAGTTKSFLVRAGTHVAAAVEVGGSASWDSREVTVPPNGSYTATLAC